LKLLKKKNKLTQEEWLAMGIVNGWCTDVVCYSHDTIEMTEEETNTFDEGYDDCLPIVRLW
jgi:hypothetical protein